MRSLPFLALLALAAGPVPDPCGDARRWLPALIGRAMAHGEDKSASSPQARLLGRAAPLKRLVFPGEPEQVFDVVARPLPDGESEPERLLLLRADRTPGRLHRELYLATLEGALLGGAVLEDELGEDGKPSGQATQEHALGRRSPEAAKGFAAALRGLCREARGLSAQERLAGLEETDR